MMLPEFHLRRAVLAACLCAPIVSLAAESLLEKLMRVSGLALGPGQLRDDDAEAGSVWMADIGGVAPVRWTAVGGFRSPVFGAVDASIYALTDGTLVRIGSPLATPVVLHNTQGVQKLVGVDRQSPNDLIVLMVNQTAPLATLSLKTGALTPLPFDKNVAEHARLLGQVRAQNRANGNINVNVETQRQQGLARAMEWTDIIVHQAGMPARNLSRCSGVNCSQPALSMDGSKVVFVRAEA